MRRYAIHAITLAGVVAIAASASARLGETFTLQDSDKLIVEAPGCHASCAPMGTRRECAVREPDCRVVCQMLPECKPDGLRPIQVCAVVRERP